MTRYDDPTSSNSTNTDGGATVTHPAPNVTVIREGGDLGDREPAPAGLGADAYARDRATDRGPARADDQRSIADLLKELGAESSHLVRQEVNLAKTELSEKASFYGKQGGKLAAGGAVLALGGLLLLLSLAYFVAALFSLLPITEELAIALGYIIVGSIAAAIGYSIFSSARSKLAEEPATPERTLQSLKDDKQWLTNKTSETTR